MGDPARVANTPSDAPAVVPVLQPGSGFAQSESAPPEPVGSGFGADAVAIARWDVVPFQTITDAFDIGVIAFHINRIDRVEFSVDGGPWAVARHMTRNDRTGVAEYVATLRADSFDADGPVEVRAIAYPTAGVPRLLEPLFLNVRKQAVNAERVRYVSPDGDDLYGDGTIAWPFKTMRRAALFMQHRAGTGTVDHGTLYLLAGDHRFGGGSDDGDEDLAADEDIVTANAFLTIEPAPGLTRDQVRITAGGRLDCSRVRVRNLTIHSARLSSTRERNGLLWLDHCLLSGTSKSDDVTFASRMQWTGGIYVTDSEIRDVRNGISGAQLMRNLSVYNTLSDAISNCPLVVNCRVDEIDKEDTDEHPDVLQWYIRSPLDNVIVYGLTATNARAQGIFVSGQAPVSNVAFVNVLIEMTNSTYLSQWHCSADHLLLWNTSLVNRPLIFRHDDIRNLGIRDSVFYELRGIDPGQFAGTLIENNHFIQGQPLGAGWTNGDPIWTDAANDDYAPAHGSPLLNRGRRPLVPEDVRGTRLRATASLGAVQPVESLN